MSLLDNELPFGHQIFHVEVHLFVLFGLHLQFFHVDPLEQIVDVNTLDGLSDLPLQVGIVLVQIHIMINKSVISLFQVFLLAVQLPVGGMMLRVPYLETDQFGTVPSVLLPQLGQALIQLVHLTLKVQLLIQDLLADALFSGDLVVQNVSLLLHGVHIFRSFDSDFALLFSVLLDGVLFG